MKKTTFLLLVLVFTCLTAQAQQGAFTTVSGYRMVKNISTNSPVGKPGDVLKMNIIVSIGDSVLMNTFREGGPREVLLPEKSQFQGQPVPPVLEAAYMMAKGDSATVYQTVDSLLRQRLPPEHQAAKEVRYRLSIADLITAEDKAKASAEAEARFAQLEPMIKATVADFVAGKLKDKLLSTKSGLKYLVVEKGAGKAVKVGESVQAHYYGCLNDGTMFDNSFQRGETLGFAVGMGQMIAGFDEGVQQINHGGKAYFFLPYQLAYGEEGTGPIPAKADLVFYVELQ